jgi:hypothetical protein
MVVTGGAAWNSGIDQDDISIEYGWGSIAGILPEFFIAL